MHNEINRRFALTCRRGSPKIRVVEKFLVRARGRAQFHARNARSEDTRSLERYAAAAMGGMVSRRF